MTVQTKRKRGRPMLDPSGKQTVASTHLSPAERRHLIDRYGCVSRGLRVLVTRDRDQSAGLPALVIPPVPTPVG